VTVRSKLVNTELSDNEWRHLDYYPIVNSRAHLVGDMEPWTLNRNFKQTYNNFLSAMVYEAAAERTAPLSNPLFRLQLAQYLQLQDRISEAIAIFKTIDPERDLPESVGTARMQYDYMSAYFDFFTGQAEGFKIARSVVRRYEDYPISAWRIPFLEILD
jgi:hypothetical protein